MIKKNQILEVLATTMLVYDYGKKFTLDEDENIETFTGGMSEEILKSLSEARREVLMNIKNYAPNGRVMDFIDDPDTDLQVGITKSDKQKRIIVVFRGTESMTDWGYDFRIFKKNIFSIRNPSSKNISIHSGFHRQLFTNDNYRKIVQTLQKILSYEEYKDYEIFSTGHSLGGALCTIFGYFLSKEIDNMVNIISFASPRVGNFGFKQDFDNQKNLIHYRVTNNRDIITATPMIGYKHTGINIHVSENNCALCERYNYNSYWKFSLFRCWSVSDHNIDLYYRRIKKNIWPLQEIIEEVVNEVAEEVSSTQNEANDQEKSEEVNV